MGALFDFLQKNQIIQSNALPLVHTSEAYHLKKIVKTGRITASPCHVFSGERLSYFFVGRPAFKRSVPLECEYWELPVCFIVDFRSIKPKRVFPFDSGAFQSKLYPTFISMMDVSQFEVSSDGMAAQKLIGTFFADSRRYYRLNARPRDQFENYFDVDVLNEEIKALHKLISFKDGKVDDRRFAIEIQSDEDLLLNTNSLIAIVMPETYVENQTLFKHIKNVLKASIITYPIYPLKKEYYYYAIYEKVELFLKTNGHFNV